MKSFIGAVIFICVAFSANAQLLWKVSGNGLTQPSYIIDNNNSSPGTIQHHGQHCRTSKSDE